MVCSINSTGRHIVPWAELCKKLKYLQKKIKLYPFILKRTWAQKGLERKKQIKTLMQLYL